MVVILIVVAVAVVAGLAVWFLRKPSGSSSQAPGDKKRRNEAMSPEQAALYERGLQPGEDGQPLMYALESCRHCRRTREFLEENHVVYHLLYVDQYTGDARAALMDKVRSYNPRGSFPTIVMPGGKVVVGFREQLLREALLHDSGSPA